MDLYIDDVKLNPTDANGNPVEPFVYNGTTYLPIRAVGQALGKTVQWDGSTNSAYLGKHTSEAPAVMLTDLDYFTESGHWYTKTSVKDNLGNTHTNIMEADGSSERVYRLNGQYSRMTGVFFQNYDARASGSSTELTIYGDGKMLFSGTMRGGIDPIPFDVSLSGVLELKIKMSGAYFGTDGHIGECGLYT